MRNMTESNMVEEFDGGNFFDHIDDLLEFPTDDVDSGLFGSGGCVDDCTGFPPVWSEDSSGFSAGRSHGGASDLSAELSVPYEDIVQLEWLSTFVEDSFSGGGLTIEKPYPTSSDNNKETFQSQFRTSSPVSVLESSSNSNSTSSCFRTEMVPVSHEKRARSKRPRPTTFAPRPPLSFSINRATPVSSAESMNLTKSKKQKVKIIPIISNESSPNDEISRDSGEPVRKCRHCEITKTPQWRAGPMGPKTLCNACGVRYKSGRLYPEYRPAASPTFVPSLHSNSHKKVLEMRGDVVVERVKQSGPPRRKIEPSPKTDIMGPYM